MDESAAEALRREEVEWIRKRDLAADKASAKSNSTPSQSIEYVRTSASVTMDRCYELLENYGDYLEPEKIKRRHIGTFESLKNSDAPVSLMKK